MRTSIAFGFQHPNEPYEVLQNRVLPDLDLAGFAGLGFCRILNIDQRTKIYVISYIIKNILWQKYINIKIIFFLIFRNYIYIQKVGNVQ